MPRETETAWELNRLSELPPKEQQIVLRWVGRRMSASWQLWATLGAVLLVSISCKFAGPVVAGWAGGFGVFTVWVASHSAYAFIATRFLAPLYRRTLREFLSALDEHDAHHRLATKYR